MKLIGRKLVFIVVMIVMMTSVAFSQEVTKEIYEYDAIPVTKEEVKAHEPHDKIEKTEDLTIPESRMLSIDINNEGELLICFTSKIIVFDEAFNPTRAYSIDWGKGGVPFAIWNHESGNIVYMRGSGYEFNETGTILYKYEDVAHTAKFKRNIVKWKNITYELQNRTHLPKIGSKVDRTYSALIKIDEEGKETVLCNSFKEQLIGLLLEYVMWVIWIILLILLVRKKLLKK